MKKKLSNKVSNNKKYAIILSLVICLALLAGCQDGSNVESPIKDQDELHTETQKTPEESELTSGEVSDSLVNQMNEYSDEYLIEGFTYVDGREVPVRVTIGVESLQKGIEAYEIMQEYYADITPPNDNEEYIIATFHISYDEGEIEELDMMENRASLATAGLYFALSNSSSNAQDVTSYLDNSIYDIVLTKGESAQGAVAFLQEKDNTEPLVFVGFEQIVRFYINQK